MQGKAKFFSNQQRRQEEAAYSKSYEQPSKDKTFHNYPNFHSLVSSQHHEAVGETMFGLGNQTMFGQGTSQDIAMPPRHQRAANLQHITPYMCNLCTSERVSSRTESHLWLYLLFSLLHSLQRQEEMTEDIQRHSYLTYPNYEDRGSRV